MAVQRDDFDRWLNKNHDEILRRLVKGGLSYGEAEEFVQIALLEIVGKHSSRLIQGGDCRLMIRPLENKGQDKPSDLVHYVIRAARNRAQRRLVEGLTSLEGEPGDSGSEVEELEHAEQVRRDLDYALEKLVDELRLVQPCLVEMRQAERNVVLNSILPAPDEPEIVRTVRRVFPDYYGTINDEASRASEVIPEGTKRSWKSRGRSQLRRFLALRGLLHDDFRILRVL